MCAWSVGRRRQLDPWTAMQGCIHFTLPAVLTSPRPPVPGLWTRETTARCQPGRTTQLPDGPTSGLETGSATSFQRLLHEAQLCGRLGSSLSSAARGVQPGGPSGFPDHFCAVRRPDTQQCLCTGPCPPPAPTPTSVSEAPFPEHGLEASGALREHTGVLRP